MNGKQALAILILFLSPLPALFLILLTYFAVTDPEGYPALIVFIPLDIVFFLLLRWCIRALRGTRSKPAKPVASVRQVPDKCWDCGGRNILRPGEKPVCRYCGARLDKPGKRGHL